MGLFVILFLSSTLVLAPTFPPKWTTTCFNMNIDFNILRTTNVTSWRFHFGGAYVTKKGQMKVMIFFRAFLERLDMI